MKLLFLIGKKRSGKDTTADYIMEKHDANKYQLAGPIKDALADAFYLMHFRNKNIPYINRFQLDGHEQDDTSYDREQQLDLTNSEVAELMMHALAYLHRDMPFKDVVYDHRYKLFDQDLEHKVNSVINNNVEHWSVRRLMQTLGTDIVCNKLDCMYWVKLFLLTYVDEPERDYFIVPDTRQVKELSAARMMGATVIHVVRSDVDNKDTHITERGLPVSPGDIVIKNDGSLDELYSKIDKVLEKL